MNKNKNVRGQSLVIIAIAFFALVAMAALIIDGGSLYLNRRNAQTAADAAALAGARELCVNKGTATTIQNIVNQYAITENGATAVENVAINWTNSSVTVQTMLSTSSFFARVLGYDSDLVRAEASAGCFLPGGSENLLPIAWTCRPPVVGSTEDCTIHKIPWIPFQFILRNNNLKGQTGVLLDKDTIGDKTPSRYLDGLGAKMIYIVIDSDKWDPLLDCLPPIGNSTGKVNCDINGDGLSDIFAGGERGWLYLDGTGAKSLSNIMQYGYDQPVTLPHWFPGTNGVMASVLMDAPENKLLFVPIFDAICPNLPTSSTVCPGYKVGDAVTSSSSNSATYYRVAGFAPFVVTCVASGPTKCPGANLAKLANSVKTIEGYFVDGVPADFSINPGGLNLGVYVISLMK